MKQSVVSLFSGFLFGIGLALSNMVNPDKILNFLDVTGDWDPSLALVMAGALSVSFLAFRFIPRREKPLFENQFRLPTRTDIDKSLLIGAGLFGIGWGMAGLCPGPAIANLGLGGINSMIFVFSMIAGLVTHRYFSKKLS